MKVYHSSKGQWQKLIGLILAVIIVFFFISFFMNPVDKLKDLRKLLGLDKLKDNALPLKYCTDVQPTNLCNGKEATNLEDSILLKETNSLLADSYHVCLIEKQEDWNNDLEQVDCILEYIPTCSPDYIDNCVCVRGGGEEIILSGETCDQTCDGGSCNDESFCREGDMECILSQLKNKHKNIDYYEGHTLINQGIYSEININKKVCLIDLGFQRTNNCDKKESTILLECGTVGIDITGQQISTTNGCICYYNKNDGTTGVSLIPLINENSSELCLGKKFLHDYGIPIGQLLILTNFKVPSDCENYQGCADYNTGDQIQELFKEELCSEDPCMFENCLWDSDACA